MMTLSQKIAVELELRSRALQAEAQEKYFNSLYDFVQDAWHIVEPITPFVGGWAIRAMCDHLQAITDGKIRHLLINVPPGMMKSLLVNVFWPAWEWGVRKLGHYRYICTAHSADLAIRDNVRARRLITDEWYQGRFPHIVFSKDQNAKSKFENTLMGFREAVASGSVTGSRGDRFLIDDPISVGEANSEAVLKTTYDWFKEAVPTRLNRPDESVIVVIMQRLHDRDTSGIILSEKMDFEHLCLPMEFDPSRRCSTKTGFVDPRKENGELLFPERFPRRVVDDLKAVLGEYATAGQLQQSPVPRGGGIIKREWVNIAHDAPRSFTFKLLSIDSAFKTGQQNDFTVILVVGILNGHIYVIDRVKGRFEYPELLAKTRQAHAKHRPQLVLIEDKASGQSLIQSLKQEARFTVKAVKVDTDKITRTHAVTHVFERGEFSAVSAEWTDDYIDSLCRFPYGAHDDDVDATTMAVTYAQKIKKTDVTFTNHDFFAR